jgi:hypothetical protein
VNLQKQQDKDKDTLAVVFAPAKPNSLSNAEFCGTSADAGTGVGAGAGAGLQVQQLPFVSSFLKTPRPSPSRKSETQGHVTFA